MNNACDPDFGHNGDGTIDKLCMFQVLGPNYLGELLEAIDPRSTYQHFLEEIASVQIVKGGFSVMDPGMIQTLMFMPVPLIFHQKVEMLEVSLRETTRTLNGHAEIIETTKPNQTDTTYSQMLNGLERKTIRTTMINANHVWSQSVSHATARVTSATATSSLSY
ncbi:hypothetical protein IGI04_007759 [Brassica rapa subsp. trilocularis]|uniref:Uncharacterized protein n=1 Tax=Brassica rapa subsp. trilocularis TaxID=1813537 RepID=A0ABQ7NKL8_BRACM|nr:hypothetical protein IGI04_007759 [Brassica rapa subsp. trilocularis]